MQQQKLAHIRLFTPESEEQEILPSKGFLETLDGSSQ